MLWIFVFTFLNFFLVFCFVSFYIPSLLTSVYYGYIFEPVLFLFANKKKSLSTGVMDHQCNLVKAVLLLFCFGSLDCRCCQHWWCCWWWWRSNKVQILPKALIHLHFFPIFFFFFLLYSFQSFAATFYIDQHRIYTVHPHIWL